MKKILFTLFAVCAIQFSFSQNTTTYYLIRHADKVLTNKNDRDPNLNERGKKRAQIWASVFKHIDFDLIYSSNYKRTIQTATPTAELKNLKINIYNPRKLFDEDFQKATAGKTVLVVGHSNSTPTLANKILSENKYAQIDEKIYSNLYIITVTPKAKNGTLLNIED